MSETQPAMTYPKAEQYEQWKDDADDMDMSTSEWMQAMIEAGRKKFERDVIEPDETRRELRQERNRLLKRVEEAEDQIDLLKEQTNAAERQEIVEYINENPGADFTDLVNHLGKTVPERANKHIDVLLGEELTEENDQYYPTDANPE